MKNPLLLAALALLFLASVGIIFATVRSVLREMKSGLGHDEEARCQRWNEDHTDGIELGRDEEP